MDVWGEMFSKVEGGVTDQSGPGADLGQIFFSLFRLPRCRSRVACSCLLGLVLVLLLLLLLVWCKGNYQV
jgi:hypothetical protein